MLSGVQSKMVVKGEFAYRRVYFRKASGGSQYIVYQRQSGEWVGVDRFMTAKAANAKIKRLQAASLPTEPEPREKRTAEKGSCVGCLFKQAQFCTRDRQADLFRSPVAKVRCSHYERAKQ